MIGGERRPRVTGSVRSAARRGAESGRAQAARDRPVGAAAVVAFMVLRQAAVQLGLGSPRS